MTSRDDDTLIPTRADRHELDHSDPWRPPYTGPRAGHAYRWDCDCGIPWSGHPTAAELEGSC